MHGVIYLNNDNDKTEEKDSKKESRTEVETEKPQTARLLDKPQQEKSKEKEASEDTETVSQKLDKETPETTDPKETISENQKDRELESIEEDPPLVQNNDTEIFNTVMNEYIQRFKFAIEQENNPVMNPIYVDEIASKIGSIYERVRRVIDWKEEHLVRRTAIERILKRRLISEISEITMLPNVEADKIAGPITMEFIRTGYFENGKIPEEKIEDIGKILDKYIRILKNSPYAKENALAIKTKVQFYNWILEIAACEIDETINYPYKEYALIDLMTDSIFGNLKVLPKGRMGDEEAFLQTYIGVHRSLYNLDDPLITYRVLKLRYPKFLENNNGYVEEFTKEIGTIWDIMNADLDHPRRGEFQKICEKYDAAYLILGDTMEKLAQEKGTILETLVDKEKLSSEIKEVYDERYKTLKARLFRSAIYSTLSIFVAGAASLFIFEFPVAKIFYGEFAPLAMVADILIPTALMFILVGIIKPPAEDNYPKLEEEVEKIVYRNEVKDAYRVKLDKKTKKIQKLVFTIIYLLGGLGSLYFIFKIFSLAKVPITSLYIDTANVAVVVFAAMVIRQRSKEITIKDRSSLFEFILDFFSIPLARIGAWLSSKWKEFNFVSVFFSTLVDTPFSSFIEFLEEWRNYIKEKRAEIH